MNLGWELRRALVRSAVGAHKVMAILVQCGTCGGKFRADDRAQDQKTLCPKCSAELVIRGQRVRNHDVFISYSTKDEAVALALCQQLERERVRCWIAPRNIPSGTLYADAIVEGIDGAAALLVVVSADAIASEHVEREVEIAANKKLPIVPFRIENVPLSTTLEYFLAGRQWHNAFGEPLSEHIERLLPPLKQLLQGRSSLLAELPGAEPVPPPSPPPSDPRLPRMHASEMRRPPAPEQTGIKVPSFHFGGVVPPEYFIGRDDELVRAERSVCGGNNMLLVGELRAGKTSFGKMLIHRIMGRPQNNVLGAYLNVQQWPTLSVETFFEHTVLAIVGEVSRQVFGVKFTALSSENPARGRHDLVADPAFGSFLDVYRFVRSRTYAQGNAAPEAFRIEEFADVHGELMSCIRSRGWQNCFVFYDEANRLGREQSVEMLLSHQEALSVSGLTAIYAASPAMVDAQPILQEWFVHQVRLGPFDSHEEMRRLIARYYFDDAQRWEEVPAEPAALDSLWQLSQGMPFLIQLIAGRSFELAHRQRDERLASRHVAEAHAQLVREKPTAFTAAAN